MSESANVRAINALDELRSGLVQFRASAQESLQAAAQEIGRTFDWLAERKLHWQNEVRRREESVQAARRELARCEASGYRDEDGRYHQPDCSSQHYALMQAQVRLHEAEAELETVRGWINLVQGAADAYQQKARQLNDYLANDVAKASASLSSSADTLRSYTTMSAGLSGNADSLQAYATVATGLLGQSVTSSQDTILTHEHRGLTWSIKVVPKQDGSRVDLYITAPGKNPDAYPHLHVFYPDNQGRGEFAVESWSRKSHSSLGELPGGLPQYILDLIANLPDESVASPSTASPGPATPPESREGSVGGPERKG